MAKNKNNQNPTVADETAEQNKQSLKAQNKVQKKKKEKKPNRFAKRVKETASELKKVTWPSFGSVVKKTCVVLAVVLIFAVVLFGIDRLLAWLFDLLTTSLA